MTRRQFGSVLLGFVAACGEAGGSGARDAAEAESPVEAAAQPGAVAHAPGTDAGAPGQESPPDGAIAVDAALADAGADDAADAAHAADANTDEAGEDNPWETCDRLQDSAQQLLDRHQRCESDQDCIIHSVDALCLGAFLCPIPIHRGTNLDELQRESSMLSLAYLLSCGDFCPVGFCAFEDEIRSYCDPSTKRCASEPLEPDDADAGAPDAG